jgi:hypothetical protein
VGPGQSRRLDLALDGSVRAREPELFFGCPEDGELHDAPHAGGLRRAHDVRLALDLPMNAGREQEHGVHAIERGRQRLGRA